MTTIRRARMALCALAVLAALTTACGDDDDTAAPPAEASPTPAAEPTPEPEPTTAPQPTPEPEPTETPQPTPEPEPTTAPEPTPEPEPAELPDTPAVAVLSDTYDFEGGTPDVADLPASPGEVEGHVYRAGPVLAVVYVGLDPGVDACPGNSVLTAAGFQFVSNAPLPGGACDEFPTLIANTDAQGVQVCGTTVAYLTLIPSDTSGTVFVSLERPDPDVTGVGLTGTATVDDPSALPELDPASLAC